MERIKELAENFFIKVVDYDICNALSLLKKTVKHVDEAKYEFPEEKLSKINEAIVALEAIESKSEESEEEPSD